MGLERVITAATLGIQPERLLIVPCHKVPLSVPPSGDSVQLCFKTCSNIERGNNACAKFPPLDISVFNKLV